MVDLYILFSHELTDKQNKQIYKNYGIKDIIYLPGELIKKWKNIPVDEKSLVEFLGPFKSWIGENTRVGDYILIQGESGATYQMVNFAFKCDLIPLHATTKRVNKEIKNGEEIITERKFEHVIFRRYER